MQLGNKERVKRDLDAFKFRNQTAYNALELGSCDIETFHQKIVKCMLRLTQQDTNVRRWQPAQTKSDLSEINELMKKARAQCGHYAEKAAVVNRGADPSQSSSSMQRAAFMSKSSKEKQDTLDKAV